MRTSWIPVPTAVKHGPKVKDQARLAIAHSIQWNQCVRNGLSQVWKSTETGITKPNFGNTKTQGPKRLKMIKTWAHAVGDTYFQTENLWGHQNWRPTFKGIVVKNWIFFGANLGGSEWHIPGDVRSCLSWVWRFALNEFTAWLLAAGTGRPSAPFNWLPVPDW